MILIDTSLLYAIYSTHDRYHLLAKQFFEQSQDRMLIPSVILPEITFLIRRDIGYQAMPAFLQAISELRVPFVHLDQQLLPRMAQIARQYSDARFDLVDMTLMALAERLNITQIATFDRRDFSLYRPLHCPYFTLLP